MIKCIIFDLDNTLFDQVDHTKGLMNHIASILSKKYNLNENDTSKMLTSYWLEKGPFYGHFFDDILEKLSINNDELNNLIDISHSYKPSIMAYPEVDTVLPRLNEEYKIAMITDGNENVQKNKIDTLGIEKYFTKIEYASKDMKPSPKSYQAVLKHFNLEPNEAIYVGDNPNVDFITPNKMNMPTVRILKGYYKNLELDSEHEAKFQIKDLEEIFNVLKKLEQE